MSFLFIQMFIFLTAYCLFLFFVFQFQKTHKLTGVLHGKKLKAESLTVPGDGKAWFWQRVNASSISPFLLTGYENISHGPSPPCQRDSM